MGICDSKKPPVQNTNTVKNQNIRQSNRNYGSKISYSRNNSSTSYGFANTSTRAETLTNKNIMPESDYKKMTKYYYSLLTRMRGGPKVTCGGVLPKIVKFYSPKYQKTVVKKVIKINVSATKA